jgi:hypothetical protein
LVSVGRCSFDAAFSKKTAHRGNARVVDRASDIAALGARGNIFRDVTSTGSFPPAGDGGWIAAPA